MSYHAPTSSGTKDRSNWSYEERLRAERAEQDARQNPPEAYKQAPVLAPWIFLLGGGVGIRIVAAFTDNLVVIFGLGVAVTVISAVWIIKAYLD